jgi:beta-lactamase regulating signal transducer with metallopeptidase domain
MTAILNVLLEITLYSAMLYSAILLFKKIFHKHISAALNYAVWALLIIRLLMPITIDSGFSLFMMPEPETPVVYNVDGTNTPPAARISDSSVMPQTASQYTASYEMENTNTNAVDQPGSGPSVNTKIDWRTVLGLLWAIGIIGSMAYVAALGRRLNRQIRRSGREVPPYIIELIEACKLDLGIKDGLQVTMHDWLNSPALSVALRPRLLLPASLLQMDRQQVEFGIRHELMHYRRKDHLMTLLLMVLRCVHWFNPIVWLSFPQIQTDMETLCDVRVTAHLQKTERVRYINTMVELSCRPNVGYVLGMGVHKGRKALEKRVKGIFMKRKTKTSVRMAAVIAAGIMLMTCFTTACQPTPEKEIVINKGDGKLQEQIYSQGETTGKPYEAPATWQDKLSEGELNLFIDANVETPKTNGLPVALIEPDEMTDGDAANILNGLTEGNPIFALQTQITKEVLEAEILEIKQVINDPDSDFNAETKKDNPERYELRLKELQERLELLTEQHKDAPESQIKSEIELRFIPLTEIEPRAAELNDPPDGLGIAGYTERDGVRYQEISLKKPVEAPYYDQRIDYYKLGFGSIEPFLTSTTSNLRNCNLTLDEAKNIAEEFLNKLDIQDMGLSLAASTIQYNPKYDEEKEIINEFSQSYVLHYTRKVNGVQITHQLNQPDPAQQYDAYWPQELIVIAVNDSGVTQFSWVSPISVKNIINSNVELLPFSEIQDIFKRNIGMNIDYLDNDPNIIGREIHINRVVLGLTKIKQKDSSEHILIPSWNFFGYEVNKYDGTQPGGYILDENNTYTQEAVGQSFLTINAVDGSLINTDIGY